MLIKNINAKFLEIFRDLGDLEDLGDLTDLNDLDDLNYLGL